MAENNRRVQSNGSPNSLSTPGMNFVDFLVFIVVSYWLASAFLAFQTTVIPYSEFLSDVKHGQVKELQITDKQISGVFTEGKLKDRLFTTFRVDPQLSDFLTTANVKFSGQPSQTMLNSVFTWLFYVAVFLVVVGVIQRMRNGEGVGPGSFLSIEKSHARVYAEDTPGVTFADVAGVDEAKEELTELVSFLKEPTAYKNLGGRLPKGVLLVGPPGTGKTLLARAVAGEAGVPFFSISGSEFVELFVGVGAARVRDLFAQARQKAPCIVFIDELDALGKSRSGNASIGTHDEKEQTLNQLLVELDGFDPSTGIVLLAATNRPEILDQALLRAGRFDRHVLVDRPDKNGRADILKVHLKKIVIDNSVSVEEIAAVTPGFTGADLANVVNEAALLAARRKASAVTKADLQEAIERTLAGLQKKSRILNERERKVVAYHEMGHALVAMSLAGCDKVEKVSIIPRGISALGYTIQRPLEDRFIMSKKELNHKLAAMLGGRAAEELVFGEESTGAADDLVKATSLARSMVTQYGMDDHLGLAVQPTNNSPFLQTADGFEAHNNVSQQTAREIDCAVKKLLEDALQRAKGILSDNRTWLEACAAKLLVEETLSDAQLLSLKFTESSLQLSPRG